MTWTGASTTFPTPLSSSSSSTTSTQWPGPARRGLLIPVRLTGPGVGSKVSCARQSSKGAKSQPVTRPISVHDSAKIKSYALMSRCFFFFFNAHFSAG